jgi:carbonic anhydrase
MVSLVDVYAAGDILPAYRGAPIERLLRVHNLGQTPGVHASHAELFICTCIDRRIDLRLPKGAAFVLRTAGARLDGNEFEAMFAVAIGGVTTVATIGHTDCAMGHVLEQRDAFIAGLVQRGRAAPEDAAARYDAEAPRLALSDPVAHTLEQARQVRSLLPGVLVAPLLYRVENHRLAQIVEAP